jgi:hypothetical protein
MGKLEGQNRGRVFKFRVCVCVCLYHALEPNVENSSQQLLGYLPLAFALQKINPGIQQDPFIIF